MHLLCSEYEQCIHVYNISKDNKLFEQTEFGLQMFLTLFYVRIMWPAYSGLFRTIIEFLFVVYTSVKINLYCRLAVMQ